MAATGPIGRWRALRGLLAQAAVLPSLARFVRAAATPLGRGRLRARWQGARLFQPATVTWANRHPCLFARVADELAACPTPRLLSFGCSTGEEAFTLGRLIPAAAIDAIDANPACIVRAHRAATAHDGRVRFLHADTPDAVAPALYDAVLCLSVLRHGDLDARQPPRSTALMPFARFAAAVEALDRRVKPGGMLVLWGCSFRFTDTPVADRYRALPSPAVEPQSGPFYGSDDRRLPDAAYADFIFVKQH